LPEKRMGTTVAPVLRTSLDIDGFHCGSATSRRPFISRGWATAPAGNMPSRPPERSTDRQSLSGRTLRVVASAPPKGSTKTNRSRTWGSRESRKLAMILASGRTARSILASTSPSRQPKGWLATTTTGPVLGMRSSSSGLTRMETSRSVSKASM